MPTEKSSPKAAVFRGYRVRVVHYVGGNRWLIVDQNDHYRDVHTDNLTFTKE